MWVGHRKPKYITYMIITTQIIIVENMSLRYKHSLELPGETLKPTKRPMNVLLFIPVNDVHSLYTHLLIVYYHWSLNSHPLEYSETFISNLVSDTVIKYRTPFEHLHTRELHDHPLCTTIISSLAIKDVIRRRLIDI